MKNIVKISLLGLVATALVTMPVLTFAQDATTNAPSTDANATPAPKKKHGVPFHGPIATLDASAGTFTVGELSLAVTSTTKISTNGVPATLADFKVGDNVTGAYKKAPDGTLNATSLRLGKKKAAAQPTQ